ncbi:MAG TPA: hypothetical protein VG125_12600 [Pirellulales bacterium]|nr:hypothetical protein [Pirellulales bacterium]
MQSETSPEHLRRLRAVELLEQCGTRQAQQLLSTYAGGVPEARLTQQAQAALRRMAR